MPEFPEWLEQATRDIRIVQELLKTPLSDDPSRLTSQLSNVEAWSARMSYLLSWGNSFLDNAEQQALMRPCPPEWKALDREVNLRASVVKERRLRDILDGILKSINMRVSLGQSLLRKQMQETSKHI